MHERSLVSVKVEHRSTFKLSTFYVIKILRALMCVAKFASVEINLNRRNMVDQQLPTLLDVTCCVRLHTLLRIVGSCCAKFETGKTCCVRLHVALSFLISVR